MAELVRDKKRILIGSPSGPNFAIFTAQLQWTAEELKHEALCGKLGEYKTSNYYFSSVGISEKVAAFLENFICIENCQLNTAISS